MYKVIAFDFDGTLFESLSQCLEVFKRTVSPYAGHMLTTEEIEATYGLNEDGMIRRMVGEGWEKAAADFYAGYEKMHESITEPFDGVRELLAALGKRRITLAMITGKGEKACGISLNKLGFKGVFESVLCGEMDAPSKHKRLGELMARYQAAPNEIVYIGDSVKDVEACQSAGVRCLSAAWQSDARKEALEAVNPGFVFDSIENLRTYLLQNIE